MSPQQLLISLLVLVPLSAALLGGRQTLPLQPQIYCGRTLSRMIASLCYDVPLEDKRSEIGTMYGNLIPPYYKEQETSMEWPWIHKSTALGSLRGKRFIGNGIADECCSKPCSISEMLNYCF